MRAASVQPARERAAPVFGDDPGRVQAEEQRQSDDQRAIMWGLRSACCFAAAVPDRLA
jgi:hypothetical protein